MFRARRIMRRVAIGRAAKRSASEGQVKEAPAAVDEAPEPDVDHGVRIKELEELREQGILTEEEFAAEKKKLLGS